MVDVFIPTLGHSPVLFDLVDALNDDEWVSSIIVGDNGVDLETWDALNWRDRDRHHMLTLAPMRGQSLYAMWNQAFRWSAHKAGACAIMNDDIVLRPDVVGELFMALMENDLTLVSVDHGEGADRRARSVDVVHGTYRQGGIAGWCFMVKSASVPQIDERFRIWYGDDDLVWKVDQAGGRCGIARGVTVEHLESTTVSSVPWVSEAIAEDSALWASLGRG